MGTFLLTTGLVLILLALSFGGEEFNWKSGYIIQKFYCWWISDHCIFSMDI